MSDPKQSSVGTEDFTIGNCRATFACPQRWSGLSATGDADVRACGSCQQQVFLCRHMSDVEAHTRQGHCIAIAVEVAEGGMFLGKMEADYQPGSLLLWD